MYMYVSELIPMSFVLQIIKYINIYLLHSFYIEQLNTKGKTEIFFIERDSII